MHASARARAFWLVVLLFAGAGPSGAVSAQSPPDTTGSPAAKAPPVQQAAPQPTVSAPPAAAPAGAAERKIVVKRFEFSGNTLFTAGQLEAIVAPYTNREIALKDIYDAADKVADHYHAQGYNLAYVAPPAQRLSDGVVKLEVIEGRVGGVEVAGNESYEKERLQRYLGELRSGQVYRLEDLDAGLRRINALPGISAKATLRPGREYGTSDLLINADEDRVSATLTGDNYGRDNIGTYRATVAGAFNNPLHYGDQLQLMYLHGESDLLNYGYIGYNAPVGYSGTRASVSYAHATFSALIVGTDPPVYVDGKNDTARAGVDIPLSSSRQGGTSFSAAVTNQRSNADIAGATLTNDINLTLLELGVLTSRTFDNFAVYQASLTAATNGKSASRADCDSNPSNGEDCNRQLLRLEGDLQYVQPIVGRFDAFTHVNAVYSPDPLPPVNPFSIGGPNSVRAYPTSEERGDAGYLASLALRYGIAMGPVQSQLRVFADTGYVSRVDAGAVLQTDDDSLSSAGAGVDLYWRHNDFRLTGKVDWSHALDSHVASDGKGDDRVYASISAGF